MIQADQPLTESQMYLFLHLPAQEADCGLPSAELFILEPSQQTLIKTQSHSALHNALWVISTTGMSCSLHSEPRYGHIPLALSRAGLSSTQLHGQQKAQPLSGGFIPSQHLSQSPGDRPRTDKMGSQRSRACPAHSCPGPVCHEASLPLRATVGTHVHTLTAIGG